MPPRSERLPFPHGAASNALLTRGRMTGNELAAEGRTTWLPLLGLTRPSPSGRTGWYGCALTRVLMVYAPIHASQS
jgi:hypothetical protein